METAAARMFGTQTAHDLARWLIPADEHAAFWALPPRDQLYRLAGRAHAKGEYRVRDACHQAARATD